MSLICPICHDYLINGESTDNFVNKCGHVYHSACLLPWWDSTPEPSCPECRQPCNMDTITKIFLTVDQSEQQNTEDNNANSLGDPKADTLLRKIKEHMDGCTNAQTKDLSVKFRQQNNDFSSLLLNSNQRLTTNYKDKLSEVSKELTTVITDEHKRLLTALGSHDRSDTHETYNIPDEHSTIDGKKRTKFVYPKAATVLCLISLISLITLIIVIVYSHLILNALHSTEHSGTMKTNNISQRLDWLGEELHQIADNTSRDMKNVKLALENMRQSSGNGAKAQEMLNRLSELIHRGDQLLLEQIQTDRKINLKLEVLQNDINILKAQNTEDKMSTIQNKTIDPEKLNQLIERNSDLEGKLQHLQTVLDKGSNLQPDELRKIIENDSALSSPIEEEKGIWKESVDYWKQLINSDGAKSSSVGLTAKFMCIVACIMTHSLIH